MPPALLRYHLLRGNLYVPMNAFFLIAWIVIAYGVCLMPGPRYWQERLQEADAPCAGCRLSACAAAGADGAGATGAGAPSGDERRPAADEALLDFMTDNVKPKERAGHFIPMAGIGFCMLRLLNARRRAAQRVSVAGRFGRVALVVVAAGLMAFSIELLQELLPDWFHRGFAFDDMAYGTGGALFGALLAAARPGFR